MDVDEAYCILNWRQVYNDSAVSFWPEYGNIRSVQGFLKEFVPVCEEVFAIVLWMVLRHVHKGLYPFDNTVISKVSIDCSNIILICGLIWGTLRE